MRCRKKKRLKYLLWNHNSSFLLIFIRQVRGGIHRPFGARMMEICRVFWPGRCARIAARRARHDLRHGSIIHRLARWRGCVRSMVVPVATGGYQGDHKTEQDGDRLHNNFSCTVKLSYHGGLRSIPRLGGGKTRTGKSIKIRQVFTP